MKRIALLLLSALTACATGTRLAAAPAPVEVTLSGQKQVVSHDSQGREVISWRPLTAASFHRGDVLRYTLSGTAPEGRPVHGLALTQPIPVGTAFVPHSATGEALVTYSVDNGHTFDAAPTVRVPGPGGVFQTVPAPAAAYTAVRWTLTGAAAPGAPLRITYEVRVE